MRKFQSDTITLNIYPHYNLLAINNKKQVVEVSEVYLKMYCVVVLIQENFGDVHH